MGNVDSREDKNRVMGIDDDNSNAHISSDGAFTDYLQDSDTLLNFLKQRFKDAEALNAGFKTALKELEILPPNNISVSLMLIIYQRLLEDHSIHQEVTERRGNTLDYLKAACHALVLRQYILNERIPLPTVEQLQEKCPFIFDPDHELHLSVKEETAPQASNHRKSESKSFLLGFFRAVQSFLRIGLSATGNRSTLLWAGGLLEGSGHSYTTGGNTTIVTRRREKMIEILTGIAKQSRIRKSSTPVDLSLKVIDVNGDSSDDDAMNIETEPIVAPPSSGKSKKRERDSLPLTPHKATSTPGNDGTSMKKSKSSSETPLSPLATASAPSTEFTTTHPHVASLLSSTVINYMARQQPNITKSISFPATPTVPKTVDREIAPDDYLFHCIPKWLTLAEKSFRVSLKQQQPHADESGEVQGKPPSNEEALDDEVVVISANQDEGSDNEPGPSPSKQSKTANPLQAIPDATVAVFQKLIEELPTIPPSELNAELLHNFKKRWFSSSETRPLLEVLSKHKRVDGVKSLFCAAIARQYIINNKIPLPTREEAICRLPVSYVEYFESIYRNSQYLPGFVRAVTALFDMGLPFDRQRTVYLCVGGILEGSGCRYELHSKSSGAHVRHRNDIIQHICGQSKPVTTTTNSETVDLTEEAAIIIPQSDFLYDNNNLIQVATRVLESREIDSFKEALREVSSLPAKEINVTLMLSYRKRWIKNKKRWQWLVAHNLNLTTKAMFYAMIVRQYILHHYEKYPLVSLVSISGELPADIAARFIASISTNEQEDEGKAGSSSSSSTNIDHEVHIPAFIRAIKALMDMGFVGDDDNKALILLIGGLLESWSGNVYILPDSIATTTAAISLRLEIIQYMMAQTTHNPAPVIVNLANVDESSSSSGLNVENGANNKLVKKFSELQYQLTQCIKECVTDSVAGSSIDRYHHLATLMNAATAIKKGCDEFKATLHICQKK